MATDKSKEAMKLALRVALENLDSTEPLGPTTEAVIDAAQKWYLAEQPAQHEPVAYGMWDTMLGKGNRMMMVRLDRGQDGCTVPLYASPPAQRKPLTEYEIDCIRFGITAAHHTEHAIKLTRAIEAAYGIKEKNT